MHFKQQQIIQLEKKKNRVKLAPPKYKCSFTKLSRYFDRSSNFDIHYLICQSHQHIYMYTNIYYMP